MSTAIFTPSEYNKLNWSFWLSIFCIIFVIITFCIAIAALVIALKQEHIINLFSQAVNESKLLPNSDYKTLYTYYTQSNDKKLKKYSGQFQITVNNSSAINFIITDENDFDITGNIEKGEENLPTIIPFISNNDSSQLKLKYKTNNSNIVLRRIDLKL